MRQRFSQVDVFTGIAFTGNPLAVIHDADALSATEMAAIARWTNLSETTFLLKPTVPQADYRVRIFTPGGELPFAGHPTLGSAFAWQAAGYVAHSASEIIQECAVGLVRIRREVNTWYFQAPPLIRTGPLGDDDLSALIRALKLNPAQVLDHQWVDNGPGWCALMLDSAASVLACEASDPGLAPFKLGLIGAYPKSIDAPADFEVRAFVGSLGVPEDPVTGSLNAGIAQWLFEKGLTNTGYSVSQGTRLGRQGRVYIKPSDTTLGRELWIGGMVTPVIDGEIQLAAENPHPSSV